MTGVWSATHGNRPKINRKYQSLVSWIQLAVLSAISESDWITRTLVGRESEFDQNIHGGEAWPLGSCNFGFYQSGIVWKTHNLVILARLTG
jgi:hypothetical protein